MMEQDDSTKQDSTKQDSTKQDSTKQDSTTQHHSCSYRNRILEEPMDNTHDSTTDGDEMNIYIRDFPVQVIFMERCEETLDYLLSSTVLSEEEMRSMLMQVTMTLALYQHRFQFTHNDLHTNNVMWSYTNLEYIDYLFRGNLYRVPTFGRIFKIIDFGRSIYTVNGKLFGSDGFSAHGDAYSQYNCAPFYDESKPEIRPNYSFDLCMLACALFGLVFPGRCPGAWMYSEAEMVKLTESQKMVLRWCRDDRGKNVEFTQTGQVRYPGFKLYKMIARTVHNHVPAEEIDVYMTFAKNYIVDGSTLVSGAIAPIFVC